MEPKSIDKVRLTRMLEMLMAGFCGECTHALDTETVDEREVDYCWFCEHTISEDGTTVSHHFCR